MSRRLLTAGVVLFWLASVAWLCATVWAPPESRMAQIDPMEVYEVFFTSAEATEMALLENGRRRGDLIVSASRRPAEPPAAGATGATGGAEPDWVNALSVNARLLRFAGRGGEFEVELSLRALVDFSPEMERRFADVSLRLPARELTLGLRSSVDPPLTEAEVVLGRETLFSFSAEEGGGVLAPWLAMASGQGAGGLGAIPGLSGFPALPGLSGISGLPGGGGGLLPSLAGVLPRPEGADGGGDGGPPWRVEARRGSFAFGGHSFRAYLLILRLEGRDEAVRVYLSESGEPLRIATDFGFEAVSEILVPLDAYRPGTPGHAPDSP